MSCGLIRPTNVALLLLIVTTITTAVMAIQCGNYDTNMGATFDLAELHRVKGQPAYVVTDGDIPCTKQVEQNYTYVFNVCGNLEDGVPRVCENVHGVAAANSLQVDQRGTPEDTSDDWCYITGFYTDPLTKVSLIDMQDPSKGISITSYGDYCKNNKQRVFKVDLPCANKLNPIPTHAYEVEHCSYKVTMPSVYGCPLECPVANRELCGGNGHCAYDYDKRAARCYCNKGYGGANCAAGADTDSSSSAYSPALTGLIVTLFVIILALVGSIVYMYKQVSAYKDDMAHYQVLRGDGDDEGSITLNPVGQGQGRGQGQGQGQGLGLGRGGHQDNRSAMV